MPSTPIADPPATGSSGSNPDAFPKKTVRIRPAIAVSPDTTDYELSASAIFPQSKSSIALPPIRFVEPLAAETTAAKSTATLDPETRKVFHQRLRLCCIIAAVPMLFFFVCAVTSFIEPFGKGTVGMVGTFLAGTVLAGLIGMAVVLLRDEPYDGNTLRAMELGVFGAMGLFFAYWQFIELTASPMRSDPTEKLIATIIRPVDAGHRTDEGAELTEAQKKKNEEDRRLDEERRQEDKRLTEERKRRDEGFFVFAITLITHLNWVALIVFHGMLVPNSLMRGASVAFGMALLALIVDGVAVISNEFTRNYAHILFLVGLPALISASILAVFGTAKTARLQEQVAEAKQMIRELGQYRLRRRLGAGGMGEVYLAEHALLKRPCAIKRIHPKYLDHPDQIRRFEREVQATARLRHPNTVEIYDYGRADDGTFYYVMEYLAGQSLEDLIGRYGPMPEDRVIYLLRQVCGALREAHRHELIHRDIKPSNIIVLPGSTPHDVAKLVDFGLVHSTNWAGDPDAKLTRDGLIVGTPEYMSPEQAQGLSLDVRSDLFSLGSVAYYLLTAKEPFHRETAMKTLLAVVSDEPPPIREANPFVPEDLAAVVSKCLVKDAGKRWQSAQELETALGLCRGHADWTETKATDWWDAHPGKEPGTGTDLDSLPLRAQAKV